MKSPVFKSYDEAVNFLMYGLAKSGGRVFRGEEGLAKTKRLCETAGNPQAALKAIHVAGTSGKGSVAYMIESILRAHGFSTGLSVSPHVYDIRERTQIDSKLVVKREFLAAFNQFMPAIIDRFIASESPTYFQATTLLAFKIMKQAAVDYAVIETGLGGLYDSTNVLERSDKMCVLTRLGKDHTNILGRSYKAIAMQKAGIIKPKNQVIALHQRADVNRVFKKTAQDNSAKLSFVGAADELSRLAKGFNHTPYQQENAAIALATVRALAQRDSWMFSIVDAVSALEKLKIPGRFEAVAVRNKAWLLDGAHNAQKISALVSHYRQQYGEHKTTCLLALKSDKDYKSVIKALQPVAAQIVCTKFLNGQDMSALAHEPVKVAQYAESIGIPAIALSSVKDAVAHSLKIGDMVLVTGSNYLLGDVHRILHTVES